MQKLKPEIIIELMSMPHAALNFLPKILQVGLIEK